MATTNPKATNGSSQPTKGNQADPSAGGKAPNGAKNGVKANEEDHHVPNGSCRNLVIINSAMSIYLIAYQKILCSQAGWVGLGGNIGQQSLEEVGSP